MFNFLRFNILGIDISDYSIEVVSLKRSFRKPKINAYNRLKLKPGIVNNGKILKPELLVENLVNLLKTAKPAPIKDRLCLLALPESQVFTHTFKLPSAFDKDKVRKSILYEIERIIPISLQESYYDFQILRKDKENQEVFFAATLKKLIYDYIDVLKKADLIPVAFDLESASLARALISKKVIDKNIGVLLIDIGARTTNVNIFVNNNIGGSLTIPIAGDNFTKKIAQKMKIKYEQAEDLKVKSGFDPNKKQGVVFNILTKEFEPIIFEIRKYIRYLEEQNQLIVDSIILGGGSALLPQIQNYFKSQFKQKVQINNPLNKVNTNYVNFPHQNYILYSNVFGLGLRGLAKDPYHSGINLLSQAKHKIRSQQLEQFLSRPKMDAKLITMIISLIAGIIILIFLSWYKYFYLPKQSDKKITISNLINYQPVYQNSIKQLFTWADEEDRPANAIIGRLLITEVSLQKEFKAGGEKEKSLTFEEEIKLVNNLDREQILVANTRLLSKENILLRLKERATIPPRSQIMAKVYSDSQDFIEINAQLLTIPGLSESLQQSVYGQIDGLLTSKEVVIPSITEDDISLSRDRLLAAAGEQALIKAQEEINSSEFIIPTAIRQEDIEIQIDSDSLDYEGNYKANISAAIAFLVLEKATLLEKINKVLDINYQESEIEKLDYKIEQIDFENSQIYVIINTAVDK